MNWREWSFNAVSAAPEVINTAGGRVIPRGSLRQSPDQSPFVIIHFMTNNRGPFPGSRIRRLAVWVHDRGGSYFRIDEILRSIRDHLETVSSEQEFISAFWEADGPDQEDEAMNTLTRSATYRIASKES